MRREGADSSRRAAWLVAGCLFVSYAWFFQGGGWNPNARLDLTRALATRGTIAIDAERHNTDDWALAGGHYYANKAPGFSFVALPGFVLGRWLAGSLGAGETTALRIAAWSANLLANALPTAALGALVFASLAAWGIASLRERAAIALALGLGTLLLPYATAFYAHAPASAAGFAAFVAPWRARRVASPGRARWLALAGGAAGGMAVLLEGSCVVVVATVAAALACDRRGRNLLPAFLAGGLPFALALGLYDFAAWGHPLRTHLAFQNPGIEERRDGALFGAPDLARVFGLTLSPFRGLFFSSPLLLLAFAGYGPLWRRDRFAAAVCAAAPLALFAAIASFHAWPGGWAPGPRYLVPAIPFLFPATALGMHRFPQVAWGVAGVSVAIMLAVTAVAVEIPPTIRDPLFAFVLPLLLAGRVSVNSQELDAWWFAHAYAVDMPASWASFNLGELVFFDSPLSLLPLLGIWAAFALALARLPDTAASATAGPPASRQTVAHAAANHRADAPDADAP